MKKYIMVILNWKQGALCDIVLPFCVRTIDKKKQTLTTMMEV